ncbi:MAG: prepilin-type N-terminal cleavage/methylation domain-containing protein [Desulfobacterales bacterium]
MTDMATRGFQLIKRFRISRSDSPERKDWGFTLLEILVTMAVAAILSTFIARTFLLQQKIYDVQGEVTDMVQRARSAVDLITREVRLAGYDPTGVDFDGIVYDASALNLLADLNADGDTSDENESIVYSYDSVNNRINRNDGSGNVILADDTQLSFAYLAADGSATTTTDDIRRIKILIIATAESADKDYPENGGYRTYTLTSSVTPKNLDF